MQNNPHVFTTKTNCMMASFSKVNLEKDRLSLRCLGINLGRKLAARYVILDS